MPRTTTILSAAKNIKNPGLHDELVHMFEKVLVPTDFSKYTRKVIECVGDVPGVKGVVLLNVVASDPLARVWDPVAEVKDTEKKLMGEGKFITAPGVKVKLRAVSVLEGEVASSIQQVANEEKVSLVMMGARGESLVRSSSWGASRGMS